MSAPARHSCHSYWAARAAAVASLIAGVIALSPRASASSLPPSARLLSQSIRFASAPVYPLGSRPGSYTAADLDGAGGPDILALSRTAVSVLPNAGGGTFGSTYDVDMAASLSAFAVADLNGYGRLDLIGAGAGPGSAAVIVRRGSASAGFDPAVAYPLSANPSDVVATDFDGDGHADVATVSADSATVSLLLNDGHGALGAPATFRVPPARPGSDVRLLAGDLDSDGLPDLAVLDRCAPDVTHGVVSILLNRGAGSFELLRDVPLPDALYAATALDANHDGHADLALITPSQVLIMRGHGDGGFDDPVPIGVVRGMFNEFLSIRSGDLDRDGNDDLVYCYHEGGYWGERNFTIVMNGRGDGTFSAPKLYYVPPYPQCLALADFNADGWLDVATCATGDSPNGDPGGTAVLLGYGGGSLAGVLEVPIDPGATQPASGPRGLEAARLRGRHAPDLVLTERNRTFVILNQGGSAFAAAAEVGPGTVRAVADLDRDGRDDLVLTSQDTTWTWRSAGDGQLELTGLYAGGEWIGLADLDGDGRADLALRTADGHLAVRRGLPHGNFGELQAWQFVFRPETASIRLADLDGDGLADVLTGLELAPPSGIDTDSLAIQFNRGGGCFTDAALYGLPATSAPYCCQSPREIAVGDLNGDRLADVVVLDASDIGSDVYGALNVFLQRDGRRFERQGTYDAGNSPADLHLADLNGDALREALTVNSNGGLTFHFYFHENGGGVLLPYERCRVADFSTNLAVADLDEDGRPDIVTYSPRWSSLVVLHNESSVPPPTATLISLVSSRAEPGWVALVWNGAIESGDEIHLYRRTARTGWDEIAALVSGATGALRYDDRAVVPGERYGYRLGIGRGADEEWTSEAWVEVPAAYALALQGARPNPARGVPVVAFSLPTSGAVTLELFDVSGRRLARERLDGLCPGDHLARLDPGPAALRPGVYLLRLSQGERSRVARLSVID